MNNKARCELKVLHGPVNVGNQPWGLSRHERLLGCRSDLVINYNTWLNYPVDRCLGSYQSRTFKDILRRALFGISAPVHYDVLHYYFGRSFLCWDDYGSKNRLWFADLKLAKRIGRKVFMTLQGCDIRVSELSATANRYSPCQEGHCRAVPSCRSLLDLWRKDLAESVLPLADRVFVLNPDLKRFVPHGVFLPYASVDPDQFFPERPCTDGPITILHAPSDDGIKGTSRIVAAVDKLKALYPIDFVLIQGLPHARAMELYRSADLVIDQLLCGWYGALAVEAMAMGKPVACYLREDDLGFIPAGMRADMPIVRITAETLEGDLEKAIQERLQWPEWGEASRRYVFRWHSPKRIARAMVDAYRHPSSEFDANLEKV